MMALTVGIIILMTLAVISAILALESKNFMLSIISILSTNVYVWGVFMLFNAHLVAWLQLIIYGGGLTALFLVVIILTESQKDESFDLKRTIIGGIIALGFTIFAIIIVTSISINTTAFGSFTNAQLVTELWKNRSTDIILQALLFFATSVAISVLFLQYKKKEAINL